MSSPDKLLGLFSISFSLPRQYIYTCFSSGLINQPSLMPQSIYSDIFCCVVNKLSVGESSSITKSGSIGAKPLFCLSLKLFQRSLIIQLSGRIRAQCLAPQGQMLTHRGDRIALLDSLKPVDEPNATPNLL